MTKYILTRTLRSLLTVTIVFVTVFMLLRLMPLSGYFPQEILKETDEATRMTYLRNQGLLDHPFVQLWRFVKNLFQGDLGRSLTVYPKVPIITYFNFVDDVEIPVISETITTETTYGRRKTV